MSVRFQRRGRGITERHVPVLTPNPVDMRDTLKHAADAALFEGWVREVEERARAVLVVAGHDPDRPGTVSAEEDTSPQYAGRILRLLQITRGAIRRGSRGRGCSLFAVRLGYLVREHDLRPDAVRGFEAAERLKEIAETANQKRHVGAAKRQARWNSEAAKIWRKRPELSKTAVAKAVRLRETQRGHQHYSVAPQET